MGGQDNISYKARSCNCPPPLQIECPSGTRTKLAFNNDTRCLFYTCVDVEDFECPISSCDDCSTLNESLCVCEDKTLSPCTQCVNGTIAPIECPVGYICNDGRCIPNGDLDKFNDIINVDINY